MCNGYGRMNFEDDKKIEEAMRMLCEYIHIESDRPKRILMHDMRVGMYLYGKGYDTHVIIAGFLHDLLEWSACDIHEIEKRFGQRVRKIVQANTKDRTIENATERRKEYVQRCVQVGEDALIVKAADALDSYRFYKEIKNEAEMARAQDIMRNILECKHEDMRDGIFDKIKAYI